MSNLREQYEALTGDRSQFLTAAENAAELTLPPLFPRSDTATADFEEPFDSFTGTAVVHLASKMMTVMMPPNSAGFRLDVSGPVREELESDSQVWSEVQSIFTDKERAIMSELETLGARSKLTLMLKLLVVTGNGCLWIRDEVANKMLTVVTLRDYVVKRDSDGKILRAIIRRRITKEELPSGYIADADNEDIYLYAGCVRQPNGKYKYTRW